MLKYISVVIKPVLTTYDFIQNKNEHKLKALFPDTDIDQTPKNILYNYPTAGYMIYPIKTEDPRIIDYDYGRENLIRDKIRDKINEAGNTISKELVFYVPLYNDTDLEYRHKYKKKLKPVKYLHVFDSAFKQFVSEIPSVNSVTIKPTLDIPLKEYFSYLKSKYPEKSIQFFEYLFYFDREKSFINNLVLRSAFDKVLILYKPTYLEKGEGEINPEYYYELMNTTIDQDKVSKITDTNDDNVGETYVKDRYITQGRYKCIGKFKKIGGLKYIFTVQLNQILFPNSTHMDVLKFRCIVKKSLFGFTYKIDEQNLAKEIIGTSGKVESFDVDDYNLFRYKNIDKSDMTKNYELFLPKEYPIDKSKFKKFLKKDIQALDFLTYLKSPSELKKYEDFVKTQYEEYKQGLLRGPYSADLYSKLEAYYDSAQGAYSKMFVGFKDTIEMLFITNTPFHFKPRQSSTDTITQYKIKLDSFRVESSKDPCIYKKDICDAIDAFKPDHIVKVELFLKKKDFTALTKCNEIKFKIKKLSRKIIKGGKKLKKKMIRNTKKCISISYPKKC
jgi:hypothetical protein